MITQEQTEFTYENVGAGHCSFVDHFVVPNSLYGCIDTVEYMDNRLNPSFHGALKLVLKLILKSYNVQRKYMKRNHLHGTG